MKTRLMQAAGLAVLLAASASASAIGTILFDRDGGGGASGVIKVDTFQYLTDNALAQNLVHTVVAANPLGGSNIVTSTRNTSFDLYMQAAIGSFTSTSFSNAGETSCIGDGGGGSTCGVVSGEFTYRLGVSQTVNSDSTSGTETTIGSILDGAGAVNFFEIYYQAPADRSQLAGTGYGNGTKVLGGVIVDNTLDFTLDQDDTKLRKLDNFGADNRSTLGTYVGNGSAQFDIDVTFQDNAFFKSDLKSLSIAMNLTTTTATPFNQAQPAASIDGHAPDYGTDQKTGTFKSTSSGDSFGTRTMNDFNCADAADAVGTSDCDFQLQNQSASAFFNPVSIPEPGSLALLGLGLGAFGLMGLRRRRSQS